MRFFGVTGTKGLTKHHVCRISRLPLLSITSVYAQHHSCSPVELGPNVLTKGTQTHIRL